MRLKMNILTKQETFSNVKTTPALTVPASWQKGSDACLMALLLVVESVANALQALDAFLGLKG